MRLQGITGTTTPVDVTRFGQDSERMMDVPKDSEE